MKPIVRTVINPWKIKWLLKMNDLTVIVIFFLLFGEWSLACVVFLAIYSLEQEYNSKRDKSFED